MGCYINYHYDMKYEKLIGNCYMFFISYRTSPGSLLSLILGFNNEQRDCVIEMGFGSLLDMKMTDVPGALIYYVLDCFNEKTRKIEFPTGDIDVTRESINQILGFPMGSIKLKSMGFRGAEDRTYNNWENQFKKKTLIRLNEIKMKLASSNEADMNFNMNFIALVINSLCESSSCGKANYYDLNYIKEHTVIRDIDWCSYLIDCLIKTKKAYTHSDKSFFVGPSTYLVVSFISVIFMFN